jgi:hypothetical protein
MINATGSGATATRKNKARTMLLDVVRLAVAAGQAKQSRANGTELTEDDKKKLNIGMSFESNE